MSQGPEGNLWSSLVCTPLLQRCLQEAMPSFDSGVVVVTGVCCSSPGLSCCYSGKENKRLILPNLQCIKICFQSDVWYVMDQAFPYKTPFLSASLICLLLMRLWPYELCNRQWNSSHLVTLTCQPILLPLFYFPWR